MSSYPYGRGTRTVYLLHFDKPLGHARHYLGQTDRDVEVRLNEHMSGGSNASRLCRKAVQAGIKLVPARVWHNAPRCFEQKLKNRGGLAKVCPMCSGPGAFNRGKVEKLRPPYGPRK